MDGYSNSHISIDILQIYTIAVGDFFLVFIFINFLLRTVRERIALFISKYLTYLYFIYRYRLLDLWTLSGILVQLIYIALNVFYLDFRVSILLKANLRTKNLSLVNIISLLASPYYSFLADILDFRLDIYRYVHRSIGIISFTLLLFYVLIAFQRTSFFLRISEYFYRTIIYPYRYLRYLILITYRQNYSYICSCYSSILFYINPSIKSFFIYTKYQPYFLLTRFNVIYYQTRFFPIYISISSLDYLSLRQLFNILAFYSGIGTSVTVIFKLLLFTPKARLRLRLYFSKR